MQYPIFQSIVNQIESSLKERGIEVKQSRRWVEKKINAMGLEIVFDLSEQSVWLRELRIHFDWDSFRERNLAKQLKGTRNHPFLKMPFLGGTQVSPLLDVELTWTFNVDRFGSPPAGSGSPVASKKGSASGNEAEQPGSLADVDRAASWMEEVNRQFRETFSSRSLLSRWHIELAGDGEGKRLESAELITYFQFTLEHLSTLQQVHTTVERRLKQLLFVSRKVVQYANGILPQYAAA